MSLLWFVQVGPQTRWDTGCSPGVSTCGSGEGDRALSGARSSAATGSEPREPSLGLAMVPRPPSLSGHRLPPEVTSGNAALAPLALKQLPPTVGRRTRGPWAARDPVSTR